MGFVAELKRRNVIRMAGLYLVGAWLVVQVASTLLPMFAAPDWAPRAVVIGLVALFLPVLLFSWVYELTPEGLKRESEIERHASITPRTGQRIEHAMVVLLAVALAYFAFDKFVLAPRKQAVEVAEARKEGGAAALVDSYGDRSIAVLPFVNMSADKEQEYFAEELLNRLAKVQGLRVIARTSSFSFKGKDADVATIAKALGVANLLEGSVRRSGNQLRISAQLIRTADDSELWSDTYDREMADIFAMQDEISESVVTQLKLKLLAPANPAKEADPETYAQYLEARQLRVHRSRESLARAEELLKQIVTREPGFAEAWSELSTVYRTQSDAGLRSNAEGYPLAREAADKALALHPGLASAELELANLSRADLDLAAVAMHVSRAAAASPADSQTLRAACQTASDLGRHEQAIALCQALVARDPTNPAAQATQGLIYFYAGRTEDSLARYQEVLRMSPDYITAHDAVSDVLRERGELPAALAEAQREADGPWRLVALAKVYHAMGRKTDSDAALAEMIRRFGKDGPFNIAYVYALRGEPDLAFEWLDKAVQERDPGMTEVAVTPYFNSLHADPRWQPFLRKIGLAPEQLAKIKLDVPIPEE